MAAENQSDKAAEKLKQCSAAQRIYINDNIYSGLISNVGVFPHSCNVILQ